MVATSPYNLKIDPELQAYLPGVPRTTDALLEQSLLASGRAIEPIIVWRGHRTIIDGHRRYAICKKNMLLFEVRELDFPNKEAVKEWMDKHQLQRRNLSSHDHAIVLARQLERETKRLTELRAISDSVGRGRFDTGAKAVAAANDVSVRTVWRAKRYADAMASLPQDIRDRLELEQVGQLDAIRFAAQPPTIQRAMLRDLDSGDYSSLREVMRGIGSIGDDDDEDDDRDACQVEPDEAPKRDTVSRYQRLTEAEKERLRERSRERHKEVREEERRSRSKAAADDQHLTAHEYAKGLEQLLAEAQETFEAAETPEQITSAKTEFFDAMTGRLRFARKQLGQVYQSEQADALKRFNEVKAEVEALLAAKTSPPAEPELLDPPPPPDQSPLVAAAMPANQIDDDDLPLPSDGDTAMDPEDAFREIEEDARQLLLKIDRLHIDTGREHPGEHGSVLRAIEGLGKSLKDWKWVVVH